MNTEDLTKSPNVGVRWQAEMEEHLKSVRERSRIVTRLDVLGNLEVVAAHAAVMQAHATAALALAVANGMGDIETALSKLAETAAMS